MTDSHSSFEDRLPDDLRDVAVRLHSERAEATGLDLDRMKTRAMANAAASRPKGLALKSRGIAVVLTLGLMAAGTGGCWRLKASNSGSRSCTWASLSANSSGTSRVIVRIGLALLGRSAGRQ